MNILKAAAHDFSRCENFLNHARWSRSCAIVQSEPAEPQPRRRFAFQGAPFFLRRRLVDLSETLPRTIRQTSDCLQFGGMRVLVRELPAKGWIDVPDGISHYWLGYTQAQKS